MKRITTVFLSLISFVVVFADINTDRAMAKIARDTKTYISADARAATEQEAYDIAMSKLTELVANFMKKTDSNNMPDAIYLSQMSGIYDRLTNHIGDNRYRVMLYVKKADIMPMSDASGAIVLSKNEEDSYTVLPTSPAESLEPVVVTDTVTVVQVIEKPMHPVLSTISSKKTKDELTSTIQSLGQSGSINGAAKFPIDNINDFYVAVISRDEKVVAILHCDEGFWKILPSGEDANLNDYNDCTAYWFTLSSK